MWSRLMTWLRGRSVNTETVQHEMHWIIRGSQDSLLHGLPPLGQDWIDRHQES